MQEELEQSAASTAAAAAQHQQELQLLREEATSTQAQLAQLNVELGSAQLLSSQLTASKVALEATVADLQTRLQQAEQSSGVRHCAICGWL